MPASTRSAAGPPRMSRAARASSRMRAPLGCEQAPPCALGLLVGLHSFVGPHPLVFFGDEETRSLRVEARGHPPQDKAAEKSAGHEGQGLGLAPHGTREAVAEEAAHCSAKFQRRLRVTHNPPPAPPPT